MNEIINKTMLTRKIFERMDEQNRISLNRNHWNCSQESISEVLYSMLKVIEEEVANGNTIQLSGYLTILPVFKEARRARNVYEDYEMMIPAGYKLKVKVGKKLKDACEFYNKKLKENDTDESK